MLENLNTHENGLNMENECLIDLNTNLISLVLKKDKTNMFKIMDWFNKALETNNKYDFQAISIILNLNNENDFKTFKKLCMTSVSDLKDFNRCSNGIDLNNAFVYVFENSYEYILYNNKDFENFVRDYLMYTYYNDFLFDLFMFLSSLI